VFVSVSAADTRMLAGRCTWSRRRSLGCRRRRHPGYQGNDAIAVARTTSTRRATDPQLTTTHLRSQSGRFRQSLRVTQRGKAGQPTNAPPSRRRLSPTVSGQIKYEPGVERRGRGRHVHNSRIIGIGSILPETSVMHLHGGVQVAQRNRYVHPRCDLTPREAASSG